MKIRLQKLAGDNNKGDYVPNGFWVYGHVLEKPKKGYGIEIAHVIGSADDPDGPESWLISTVTRIWDTDYGFLIIANKQLWTASYC